MSTITTINATDKPRLSREVINTNFANLNASKAEIADVALLAGAYANPSWIISLAWAKIAGAPATYAPSAHTHPFSEITGTIANAQVLSGAVTQHQAALALAASQITSGALALARGGTGADLSATGGANQVLKQTSAGGVVTVAALVAGDIPALDTAKITTGTFADARIAASNVTQHQAALSIASSQVTGTFVGATKLSDYSTAFVNSITGTPNQVIASASVGGVTLSLPQSIHTASTPTFAGLTSPSLTYAGTLALSATGANVIALSTNGSERARVSSGGNLLFGTTTDDGSSKLQVAGTVNILAGYGLVLTNSSGNSGSALTNTGATGTNNITFTTGGSARGAWSFAGNFLAGGTTDGNYRLDVQSSGSSGTLRVYDQTATTGVTRARFTPGAAQSTVPLIAATSGNPLTLGIGDTSLLTLNSSGELVFNNNKGVILQNVGGSAAASLYRDTGDAVVLRNATTGSPIYLRAGGDYNMVSLTSAGAFTVYNTVPMTGVTSLVVRAGAGQGTTMLQSWQNNAGSSLTLITPGGAYLSYGSSTSTSFSNSGVLLEGGASAPHARLSFLGDGSGYQLSIGGRNGTTYTSYMLLDDSGPSVKFGTTIKIGFFGVTPVAKQTATDLASVIALLQAYGLSN